MCSVEDGSRQQPALLQGLHKAGASGGPAAGGAAGAGWGRGSLLAALLESVYRQAVKPPMRDNTQQTDRDLSDDQVGVRALEAELTECELLTVTCGLRQSLEGKLKAVEEQ